MRAWLREPITLFILVGSALFALDRWINGTPVDEGDTRRIVVTTTQQAALRESFRAERGREPDQTELQARLAHWIDEEVLYREAMMLGLDRKDPIVHRQLVQKMRLLLDDMSAEKAPSESELQIWLDQHRERYGRPSTLSFDQIFLSRSLHGDQLQAVAQQLKSQIEKVPDSFAAMSDPFPTGTTISRASTMQIRRDFGPAFASAIQDLAIGTWSKPIASSFGLHLVRITAKSDFEPASLADVRERVLTDYRLYRHDQQINEALERLKKKYQVKMEAATP